MESYEEDRKKAWEDLDITHDELSRLTNAMKRPDFRDLLREYADEVSDPENRRIFESEMTQLERERGFDVTFVHPEPGYVIKTSLNGSTKCFINICKSDIVAKPTSQVSRLEGEQRRSVLEWKIPIILSPPRDELDRNKERCQVFDTTFHPDSLYLAQRDLRFKGLLNETAIDTVEKTYQVQLDRKNMRFPNIDFMGVSQPSVLRKACDTPVTQKLDIEPEIYQKIMSSYDKARDRHLKKKEEKPKKAPPKARYFNSRDKTENDRQSDSKYTKPRFIIKYQSHLDMDEFRESRDAKINATVPKKLVVIINLPLLRSADDATLDVQERCLSLKSETPAKYSLKLPLSYRVDPDKGTAKFDVKTKKLTVTLPVIPTSASIPIDGKEDSGVESDLGSPVLESQIAGNQLVRENSSDSQQSENSSDSHQSEDKSNDYESPVPESQITDDQLVRENSSDSQKIQNTSVTLESENWSDSLQSENSTSSTHESPVPESQITDDQLVRENSSDSQQSENSSDSHQNKDKSNDYESPVPESQITDDQLVRDNLSDSQQSENSSDSQQSKDKSNDYESPVPESQITDDQMVHENPSKFQQIENTSVTRQCENLNYSQQSENLCDSQQSENSSKVINSCAETALRTSDDDKLTTAFFVNPNVKYNLPAFTCNVYDNILAVTIHTKNVDPESISHRMLEGEAGLHVLFTSIGAGYFPVYYSLCLKLGRDTIVAESLAVEPWDNNVILSFKVRCIDELNFYFAGIDEDSLEAKDLTVAGSIKNMLLALQEDPEPENENNDIEVLYNHNELIINVNIMSNSDDMQSTYANEDDEHDRKFALQEEESKLSFDKTTRSISESNGEELSSSIGSSNGSLVALKEDPEPENGKNEIEVVRNDEVIANVNIVSSSDEVQSAYANEDGNENDEYQREFAFQGEERKRSFNQQSRSISESSGDELSSSMGSGNGSFRYKSILKPRHSSRSVSESSFDWNSSAVTLDYSVNELMSESEGSSMKKTVRFNDVVSRQLYRTNSSILGQRKKNQRKLKNKKRAYERRMSESENSETEEREK
ncbi:protein kintoun [Copidosoma floridanum]|uniref:protein kintoun n=1 Tax=Copidosoma floridanum TaxID=29053 RepID=UPI0006C94905|nr:protein kintoun [Copidosoma floridanum]